MGVEKQTLFFLILFFFLGGPAFFTLFFAKVFPTFILILRFFVLCFSFLGLCGKGFFVGGIEFENIQKTNKMVKKRGKM